jgi:putative SOS response-associated peptidase YedK
MCGRFVLKAERDEIEREFAVRSETESTAAAHETTDFHSARYNIAPSQIVAAIRQFETERIVSGLKWGLVPGWAKDAGKIKEMINARAETLTEKPMFRNAFRARRCIVPASGFYEWQKPAGGGKGAKQPFYFYLKDKPVFGFAALWEERTDTETGEALESCAIITTEANATLTPVHDRMPVILKPEDYDAWLDPKEMDAERLQKLLKPYPSYEMNSHAVSKQVNNAGYDSAELINSL